MLLDTDVMVDYLRGHPPARTWLASYAEPIALPGLVAMELLQGCRNLVDQRRLERELQRFILHWPTAGDRQCLSRFRGILSEPWHPIAGYSDRGLPWH